jgi:hypothetical protein
LQNLKKDFEKEIPIEKLRLVYQNCILENSYPLERVVSDQNVTFQILIDPLVSSSSGHNQSAPPAVEIDS